jgi:hypothetical protein
LVFGVLLPIPLPAPFLAHVLQVRSEEEFLRGQDRELLDLLALDAFMGVLFHHLHEDGLRDGLLAGIRVDRLGDRCQDGLPVLPQVAVDRHGLDLPPALLHLSKGNWEVFLLGRFFFDLDQHWVPEILLGHFALELTLEIGDQLVPGGLVGCFLGLVFKLLGLENRLLFLLWLLGLGFKFLLGFGLGLVFPFLLLFLLYLVLLFRRLVLDDISQIDEL